MLDKTNFGGYAIAIETYYWILENLPKGSTILELGSGKGTVELAEFYEIYSIEHDKRWIGHAKKATYIHAPIIVYGKKREYRWYNRRIIKSRIPKDYDLLLMDGPNGPIGREGFIRNIGLFNMNVPIIVDDTQREKYVEMCDFICENYNKKATTMIGSNKKFTVLI